MKILIATDGSEFSQAAVEKCCQILVKPENTAIKIVSAYQSVVPIDLFAASVEYSQELERAEHQRAEEHAEQAAATIRECFPNSNLDLTTQVTVGAPDQVVIETAEEWKADLIVIGSHGRGFWARMMLGSVTDAVIHHAPCSVLVVRPINRENE